MSEPLDHRAVEAHYDRFPYPEGSTVLVPTPPAHLAGSLSHLLRRRPSDAITTRSRIWVAGCGTQQAASIGLSFPDADVLATDVSARTLERAAELARAVGAEHVRFARRDLREPPPEERFDLVVCTGVVHHLPEPALGLRHLRDALAPGGALWLMVYHRAHRAVLAPLRSAARRLGPGDEDPLDAACRVLEAALGPRCRSPDRELLETLLSMRGSHRTFLADILLHPCEHSYDVDGMLALLAQGGLRFSSWRHPGEHRLSSYVQDPVLLARGRALDPLDEARAVHEIAGIVSPMLDVLAERDDEPARAPYSVDELLAMRPLRSEGERELSLAGGRVIGERRVAPYAVAGEQLSGSIRGGHGADRVFAVPASVLPLIEACDGRASLAELCDRFATEETRDAMLSMIETLGPADVGLLAPLFER